MRRLGRRGVAAALGASLLPFGAGAADDYPVRPITLIVPFAAGGAMDVLARLMAEQAGRSLGQNVVVDNRGGAARLLGAQAVARSEADGYTLLIASSNNFTICCSPPPWAPRVSTYATVMRTKNRVFTAVA